MKKSDFKKELVKKLEDAQKRTLREAVLNIAQYIPHDAYEDVLSLFDGEYEQDSGIAEEKLLSAIKQLGEDVEEGKYDISWEYNEGYYDGYWSEDETLCDRDGLGQILEQMLETAMKCVAHKDYPTAAQALNDLFDIQVTSLEYEDVGVDDMFENGLIHADYGKVLKCYAYAILMAYKGEERTERLLEIANRKKNDFKLSEITTLGEDEIPDNEAFQEEWIRFLMQQNRHHYEMLLIDAIEYKGGTKELERFAFQHGVTYQKTYVELVKRYIKEEKNEDAVRVIRDGLQKIKGVNENRTELADFLEQIGQRVNKDEYVQIGVKEGFYASMDLKHFLGLYNLNEGGFIAEAVVYMDGQGGKREIDYYYIHFLNGDYEMVWNECNKDKKSLGWTYSKKGALFPLFVALLSGAGTGKPCIRKLLREGYPYNGFDLFIERLNHTLKELSDEDYERYYDWCGKEIDKRVKAIVGGQHRGSYGKASSLVVSMGEVLSSRGDEDGAMRFVMKYKEEFPRHSSFQKCLREDVKLSEQL